MVSQGWENFSLSLYLIPERCNHLNNFSKLNTEIELTPLDLSILNKLSFYEITIIEQAFIQELDSSYNMQIYSNFGGIKNKGSKGLVKDEKFKEFLSLEYQGREFSDFTKNQHRDNMTGKRFSTEIREKMSNSHGGVIIYYYSFTTQKFGSFTNKSTAAAELNVSIRTVTR